MPIVDYTDKDGVTRRVDVNSEHDNPDKGIPIDVYYILDEYLSETSQDFRNDFYNRLYQVGLIEKNDFENPNARTKVRRALQSTLARDATDIIRYIEEQTS